LPCPPQPGPPPPLQSTGSARGTRWPSHSHPANNTRTRGSRKYSRTPCPPPPGPPPPVQSLGPARGTRWPSHSPRATDTHCGCCRPTPPVSAWPSAVDTRRRARHGSPHGGCHRPGTLLRCTLPPPWRAPALHAPPSGQHHQAALVSPTRASGQLSASLPCRCQHEQRACTRPCAWPSTP